MGGGKTVVSGQIIQKGPMFYTYRAGDQKYEHDGLDHRLLLSRQHCRSVPRPLAPANQRVRYRRLGIDPTAIEMYPDKQTGNDTDHDGYRELMGPSKPAIRAGDRSGVSRL